MSCNSMQLTDRARNKKQCQSFYQSHKLKKCNKCKLGLDNNTVRL